MNGRGETKRDMTFSSKRTTMEALNLLLQATPVKVRESYHDLPAEEILERLIFNYRMHLSRRGPKLGP